jgi:uncharacterized repeat protein (TIGR03987 family)
MSTGLLIAIITITSALVLYTIGVWSEKFAGRLKLWHLSLFWLGLACDTTGTSLMGNLAGRFEFNLHGVTGLLAIVLMMAHALWAAVVLALRRQKAQQDFHKFSLAVWLVWLVPFFSGMLGAMLH